MGWKIDWTKIQYTRTEWPRKKIMIKIDIYIDLSQSNISICFKKIFVVKEKCVLAAIKKDTSIYL